MNNQGGTVAQYAAFLGGVNVGGHNLVKMEDLRRLFTSSGFTKVATYIQSGNIMFEAPEKNPDALSAAIRKKLRLLLGSDVGVFVRTKSSLMEMVRRDPFKELNLSSEEKQYATFLPDKPQERLKFPLISPTRMLKSSP